MKKDFLAVMAIASLTSATAAFADISDIKASNNQVGIQYISPSLDYTETGNGAFGTPTGTLDTESGRIPGVALNITAMKDAILKNDYFKFEYDRSSGYTNYIGGYTGPNPTPYGSLVTTSSARITNYILDYGKGFDLSNQFMLTPYAEFGKHEWVRGVNSGEIYVNYNYGAGLLAQFSPSEKLVLSANALIGRTYNPSITIQDYYQIGFLTADLGTSTMRKAGISADYAFTKNIHGNIGIDYTSFQYGISATYFGGIWEPNSKSSYTTAKLGIGYAF